MTEETPEIQNELKDLLSEPLTEENKTEEKTVEDITPEVKEEVKEEPKKRNRISAKEKINKQRWQLGEKERELEKKNKIIAEYQAREKQAKPLIEPKADDFLSDEEYKEAQRKHLKQELEAEMAEEQKTKIENDRIAEEQKKQEDEQKAKADKWDDIHKKALKKFDDYQEVEQELVSEITEAKAFHLYDDFIDCDNNEEIVYYLGKNPNELDRILDLSARAATREITKLDSKISRKIKMKNTPQPLPNTVKGSRSTPKVLGQESQTEYNRRMNGIT